MSLELKYYYGNEAEQYSFYRIPKTLFFDQSYKSVSMEAKVLYSLMLDRMSLSVHNGWLDSEGRVYIYFTLEDALATLGCGKDKAIRLFKELDTGSGIGLIERHKQGQGKPMRIYVKNFTLPLNPEESSAGPAPEGPQTVTSEKPKFASRGTNGILTSEIPKSELPGDSVSLTSEKRSLYLEKTAVKTAKFPTLIILIRIRLKREILSYLSIPLPPYRRRAVLSSR